MTDSTRAAAAEQEVLITRIFDATRERVFRAWTDPDEVAAWYGPEHFDTPRERIRIDLRVGGRYELTMVQRDSGAEFAIGYEIIELVEPELIVLRSDPMPEMGMHEPTITRVELHDHGGKTRMTLTDGPYPAGGGHAEAGWNSALAKLAATSDRRLGPRTVLHGLLVSEPRSGRVARRDPPPARRDDAPRPGDHPGRGRPGYRVDQDGLRTQVSSPFPTADGLRGMPADEWVLAKLQKCVPAPLVTRIRARHT